MRSATRQQARIAEMQAPQRKAYAIMVLKAMMADDFFYDMVPSYYRAKVQPSPETRHLPKRLQRRSKY